MKLSLIGGALMTIGSVIGCASTPKLPLPDPTYQTYIEPVWIDKDFSTADRLEIERALKDWNWTLNGYVQFRIESEQYERGDASILIQTMIMHAGTIIQVASEKEATDAEARGLPKNAGAWTENDRVFVNIIVSRLGNSNMHAVVMHELGHTLGLGHFSIPDTLMYKSGLRVCDCVDRYTAMVVADIHGVDYRRLRPCEDHPR
jgi:hypothetical protein